MSCVAIIGLGNPGSRYSNTRHNLGFWLLNKFANSHDISFQAKPKFCSEISKFILNDRSCMLVKPLSFMNQSGKFLHSLLLNNGCDIEESIVVHDELTLSVGQMKISKGRSNAGHNGVASVLAALGSTITRLRLGIGQKESSHMSLSDYVLSSFNPHEETLLEARYNHFLAALKFLLTNGVDKAMNFYIQPLPDRI